MPRHENMTNRREWQRMVADDTRTVSHTCFNLIFACRQRFLATRQLDCFGVDIVSGLQRLTRCYQGRGEKLRDVTVRSGLSSLTRIYMWQLAGILLSPRRRHFTITPHPTTVGHRLVECYAK